MKKFRLSKPIILLFCCGFVAKINYAQVTTPVNFGGGGEYVGWDGTMGIPLDIRTTNANNIDFFTDSVLRMNLIGNALYNNGLFRN